MGGVVSMASIVSIPVCGLKKTKLLLAAQKERQKFMDFSSLNLQINPYGEHFLCL